jgi:hypothetical protein
VRFAAVGEAGDDHAGGQCIGADEAFAVFDVACCLDTGTATYVPSLRRSSPLVRRLITATPGPAHIFTPTPDLDSNLAALADAH